MGYKEKVEEYFKERLPEALELSLKLRQKKKLGERDRALVKELVDATGWDKGDLLEDLKHITEDPGNHVERYRTLLEKYRDRALKSKTRAAKIRNTWAAVLALIKLYGAAKNVTVPHWDWAMLAEFIYGFAEEGQRKLLENIYNPMSFVYRHKHELTRYKSTDDTIKEVLEIMRAPFSGTLARSYP